MTPLAPGRRRAGVLVALGVVALAGVTAWQTTSIPTSPAYAQIGPRVFAWGVALGLVLLGGVLLFQALTGRWAAEEEDAAEVDWSALAWLLGGLFLNIVLIETLGFVVASTVLFVCVARAFGSAQWVRNAGIAVVFALVTYLGFAKLLGISIGAGIFKDLF